MSSVVKSVAAPVKLTAPMDGRFPYMPFCVAGARMLPPVSLPSDISSQSYEATAEADPREESPGLS